MNNDPDQVQNTMANLMVKYVRWHCMVQLAGRTVPTLTISYERILEDPQSELSRLIGWLGFDAEKQKIAAAISRNPAKYSPPLQPGLPLSLLLLPPFLLVLWPVVLPPPVL